jgi:hypothetical protein
MARAQGTTLREGAIMEKKTKQTKTEPLRFDPNWMKNGALAFCSATVAQEKKIYPNYLGWTKGDPSKLGVLIIHQSKRGDFGINKNGLDYIKDAKSDGRIKEAYVVKVHQNGSNGQQVVEAMTIDEAEAALGNVAPMPGEYGEYWWLPRPDSSKVPF